MNGVRDAKRSVSVGTRCICRLETRIFTNSSAHGMNRRSFILQSGLLAAAGMSLPAVKLIPRGERMFRAAQDVFPEKLIGEALAQGAEYAEARFIRSRRQTLQAQKDIISGLVESESAGWSLRVFTGGAAGFA